MTWKIFEGKVGLHPQKLEPLKEVVLRFDKFYLCLCNNCKNKDGYPCKFRKNWAWKKCKYHQPIARNSFLAEKVLHLTRWLTLDEAIGLFKTELGEIYDPIKGRRQHNE